MATISLQVEGGETSDKLMDLMLDSFAAHSNNLPLNDVVQVQSKPSLLNRFSFFSGSGRKVSEAALQAPTAQQQIPSKS